MDAFAPIPPEWTHEATHQTEFCCPKCHSSSQKANAAWINRRSPVMIEDYKRKWQEFYQCQCSCVWWAWSSDRPPTNLSSSQEPDPI